VSTRDLEWEMHSVCVCVCVGGCVGAGGRGADKCYQHVQKCLKRNRMHGKIKKKIQEERISWLYSQSYYMQLSPSPGHPSIADEVWHCQNMRPALRSATQN